MTMTTVRRERKHKTYHSKGRLTEKNDAELPLTAASAIQAVDAIRIYSVGKGWPNLSREA